MVRLWCVEGGLTGVTLIPEDAPPSLYGDDGEPRFFADPAMDRFAAVLLNLTSELWVQTEKVETLANLLVAKGVATDTDLIDVVKRDDDQLEAKLQDFVTRILAPLREGGR